MPRRDGNGRRSKTVCEKTRFALDKLDDNENAFDKKFIYATSSNRATDPAFLKSAHKNVIVLMSD